MDYATLADLIERAGEDEIRQVADRDDDGVPDPAVVAAAIETAGNTIDGYLGVRFQLPLTVVPANIRGWAVAIARYHLHRDGAPDYVVRDYKDALTALQQAARGLQALPGLDGIAPAQSSAGTIRVDGPAPVFSADKLEGWL